MNGFSEDTGLGDFDFEAFFGGLDRMTLRSRKRVAGREVGGRLSTRKGRGLEPVGYRGYEPGDPLQIVDWAAYARTEKLFVREYEEERALQTRIMLDTSRSMGFRGKLGFGGKIAAGIAYLVQKENEAFGIWTFSESVEHGDALKGRKHLVRTTERLQGTEPQGGTDLLGAAREVEGDTDTRSLVVLISDFLDDLDRVEQAVYLLGEHDVLLVQVAASEEVRPKLDGSLLLRDSETGEEAELYFDEIEREQYARLARGRALDIGKAASDVGGDHIAFTTSRPPLDAMYDLVGKRA